MKFSEKEYREFLIMKIDNVLKGEADQILGDRSTSIEDKQIFMKVLEEMKQNIDNIDNNKKNRTFIKQFNERMDDDLR